MSLLTGMDYKTIYGKKYHEFNAFDVAKLAGAGKVPDSLNQYQQAVLIMDNRKGKIRWAIFIASKRNKQRYQMAVDGDIMVELKVNLWWVMTRKEFDSMKAKDIPALVKKAKEHYGILEEL